jgi:hypothetical protein
MSEQNEKVFIYKKKKLLFLMDEAMKTSDYLSENEHDQYAHCTLLLFEAMQYIKERMK